MSEVATETSETSKKSIAELFKTVHFENEYTFEGKKLSSCKIRKPKISDRKKAVKIARLNNFDDEEMESHLFAMLTNLPIEFIDELWLEDYNEIAGVFLSFLQSKKKKSA